MTRLRIDRTLSVATFCRVHFFFPPFSRFIGIDFSCVENVRQWQRHGTQSKGGVFIFALQLETFVAYSRSSLPEIDIGDTYVGVLERCFPMVLLRDCSRFETNVRKFTRTSSRFFAHLSR